MSLTTGDAVFTGDRRQHRLGPLLKSGGAGSVYPVLDSAAAVAKIYHDDVDRAEHERKVAAMLYLSPNLPDLIDQGRRYTQIAWPQSLLRDAQGRFVGFLMPAIDVQSTSELECILQERQARAAGLPTGLGAKITLAANLAAVIAELHRQGHHVVDLKPVNVRFYTRTLYMAVLDCDGFSIQGQGERFLAHQVTPDYIAPEFQGRPITTDLEEQQDRFALAVVIFQLLNFGIHPFTGRPFGDGVPTDIPGRIAQRCYAYGLRGNALMEPSPVSGHASMPADLRALFDRAFEGAPTARPSASEWAGTLRVYAQRSHQQLVVCARDRQHQHFAGLACAACARGSLIAHTARSVEAARSASIASQAAARAASAAAIQARIGQRMAGAKPTPSASAASTGFVRTPPQLPGPVPIPPGYWPPRSSWPRSAWSRSAGNLIALFIGLMVLAFRACSLPPADHPTLPQDALQQQAATASTAPASPEQAIQQVLDAADPADASRLPARLDYLRNYVRSAWARKDYREQMEREKEYQQQFERAVTAVQDRDRDNVTYWLTRALAADPNQPQAWYGMAIAASTDADAIKALTVAEYLHEGAITRTAMHQEFTPRIMVLLGTDPGRFEYLKARAQKSVAKLKGLPLAPDIERMAGEPLPPRQP